jgi:signal transduction histidine kinase
VEGGTAVLRVRDDGRGFATGATPDAPAGGHLGLRLLSDLTRDAGGRLQVESAPGHGTSVRVEVPVG